MDSEESEKNEDEDYYRKKPASLVLSKKTQNKFSEISINKKTQNRDKSPQISKKAIFENLSNSTVNFKKYLEIRFFINHHSIPKNATIYEIFQKFKKVSFIQVIEKKKIRYYSYFRMIP